MDLYIYQYDSIKLWITTTRECYLNTYFQKITTNQNSFMAPLNEWYANVMVARITFRDQDNLTDENIIR